MNIAQICNSKIMTDSICDYEYEKNYLTLQEQQFFFKSECKQLQKILDGMAVYSKYATKISRIAPLIKSANLNLLPQLRNFNLETNIPILKNDLTRIIAEYKRAVDVSSKMSYSARIGISGEKVLLNEMDLYGDKILYLENIRLEIEGTTVETDCIVIAETGVFCIEVKNYGAYKGGKIEISKDGRWKRYNGDGKEISIADVTAQVYRHIGITQRFINDIMQNGEYDGNYKYVDLHPIIAITNEKIEVENNSNIPVLRISNVYDYISTFVSENKVDKKYWSSIAKILNENNCGAKSYDVDKYSDKIFPNYRRIYQKLKVFDIIDRTFKLENLLQEVAFSNSSNLIEKLEAYQKEENATKNNINHIEVVCLRALIEDLYVHSKSDRGVYEAMILKCFNIKDLSELAQMEYEYICKCFSEEIEQSTH